MWMFTSDGMISVVEAPRKSREKYDADPKLTRNGLFDLQVRARTRAHLEDFVSNYMEHLGLSEIVELPNHDYPFRFYTTREALAEAARRAVMAIDYHNFKDSIPERKYHDAASNVWAALLALEPPRPLTQWLGNSKVFSAWGLGTSKYVGTGTTASRWYESDPTEQELSEIDLRDYEIEDELDWVPRGDADAMQMLERLRGVPRNQWDDYLEPHEIRHLREWLHEHDLQHSVVQRQRRPRPSRGKRAKSK